MRSYTTFLPFSLQMKTNPYGTYFKQAKYSRGFPEGIGSPEIFQLGQSIMEVVAGTEPDSLCSSLQNQLPQTAHMSEFRVPKQYIYTLSLLSSAISFHGLKRFLKNTIKLLQKHRLEKWGKNEKSISTLFKTNSTSGPMNKRGRHPGSAKGSCGGTSLSMASPWHAVARMTCSCSFTTPESLHLCRVIPKHLYRKL